MCGIAGFIGTKSSAFNSEKILTAMCDTIRHRGPDDSGYWLDTKAEVALGHRRLSILDLSPAGHQPMHSESGRYVIVFNGEIYNHHVIRSELENITSFSWRGHSDTEVMLAAFDEWGVEEAVKRFLGMFAIALWDRKNQTLYLIRDRMGEKPLYYGWSGNSFLFASELKALRTHPDWQGEINRDALALYLRHNYIPSPYSIYKGIHKLTPGTILTLDFSKSCQKKECVTQPYWTLKDTAKQGVINPYSGSESEAVDELHHLLRDAVQMQMVADVPLGAFLSGGVDSSTIVALMQSQSSRPVKTFTIGFKEAKYNEAEYALAVAKHLGTDHTELYISPDDALKVIPRLPMLYDEPFSDSSQIPTFLVSELTKKNVTVSLSGDAGDELFCGYNRYAKAANIWRKIGWVPAIIRQAMASGIKAIPDFKKEILRGIEFQKSDRYGHPSSAGVKLHHLSEILGSKNEVELYRSMVSHWKKPSAIVAGSVELSTALTDASRRPSMQNFADNMMFIDMLSYLPDDILVKVDRSAMGISLETRVPFLDYRIVEFAWRIPLSMKIHNGQGKWLLRQILYNYVPKELIERPKVGFGVPIDSWLRGPLRDWAEGLLSEDRLKREGFFNPTPIRQKWHEHLSGLRDWQYDLWDILMFQAWLEVQ